MKWMDKLNENIKKTVRSWLNVLPANPYNFQINEILDFEGHAIRNRIWYRGDGNELEQFYQQNQEYADRHKFWASRCTPGMDMRKIHTGLPGLIVRTLSSAVLPDMEDFEFESPAQEQLWKEMEKENRFRKKIESALKETLYIGDGAFKAVIDTELSDYPIVEWYPGDKVEFVYQRDRIREIVFKTPYHEKGRTYVLNERYGYGYIINELYALFFSKVAQAAQKTEDYHGSTATSAYTKAKVFGMLKDILAKGKLRRYKANGSLLMYVRSEIMDALEQSTEFTRKIEMTQIAEGGLGIETRVTEIDGVPIMEVIDDERFYDAFNWEPEGGGFEPLKKASGVTGAHKINVLVACGQTCKTVPKINSIYYFEPGGHTKGDGYLYQNRSFSDVFVFPNGRDGNIDSIYVDVDTTEVGA